MDLGPYAGAKSADEGEKGEMLNQGSFTIRAAR